MTTPHTAPVELRFGEGLVLSNWERFTLRESYVNPIGSFSFSAKPPAALRSQYRDLLQKGKLVGLKINGAPQATPIIVTRRQELTEDGYRINVECESVLTTPYEGSVDPTLSLSANADTAVADIILEALKPYGFTELLSNAAAEVSALTGKPIDGRAPAIFLSALKAKDIQAQPNETAYNFCQRLFARLGLALRVNALGTLLLGAPDYQQKAVSTLVQDSTRTVAGDRMLPPIVETDTNKGQFSEVIVVGKSADKKGKKSTNAPKGGIKWSGTTRLSDSAYAEVKVIEVDGGRAEYQSTDGAAFKPRYRWDKRARDVEHCDNWAARLLGIPASKAYTFQCSVDGLVSSTGHVWTPDTIVRVYCEEFAVDEEMWVLGTDKTAVRNKGQRTKITLIPKGALVLSAAI